VSDRPNNNFAEAIASLDADELLAMIENISRCRHGVDGPPNRIVPESLCEEVEALLILLEHAVRLSGSVDDLG